MRNGNMNKVIAVLLSAVLIMSVYVQTAYAVPLMQEGETNEKEVSVNSLPQNNTEENDSTDDTEDGLKSDETDIMAYAKDGDISSDMNTKSEDKHYDLDVYLNMNYETMEAQKFEDILANVSSEDMWIILNNMTDQAKNHILSLDTGLSCPAMVYDYIRTLNEEEEESVEVKLTKSWDNTYEYLKDTYGNGVLRGDCLKKSGYFTLVFIDNASGLRRSSSVNFETDDTNLKRNHRIRYKVTITNARDGLALKDDDNYRVTRTKGELFGGTENDSYHFMCMPFTFNKKMGYLYSTTSLNKSNGYMCTIKNKSNYAEGHTYSNQNGSDTSIQCVYLFINLLKNTTLGGSEGQDSQPAIVMTPITYNVVYDTNGATSGTASTQSCLFHSNYAMPGGMNRYVTIKFDTKGGNEVVEKVIETPFAAWRLQTGEVYAAGQAFSKLASENGEVVHVKAEWSPGQLELPITCKTGYDFNGWSAGYAGQMINVSNPDTITASWSPHTYTVEFLSDGEVKGTQMMTYGMPADLLTLAEMQIHKAGYTFKGWNLKYADGQTVQNLTSVNGDKIKLIANWEAKRDIPYTINRYVQKELDHADPATDYELYKPETESENGVLGTELQYASADENITVPAASIAGYETPDDQMIRINGDGSTVVNFYYNLTDHRATLTVNHYYQTEINGEYVLYDGGFGENEVTDYHNIINGIVGDIVTPEILNDKILGTYSKKYNGFHLQKPEPQTITLTKNSEVNYYYKMVQDDSSIWYTIEHWIQREVGAQYELYATDTAFSTEDAVMTPALYQKAIDVVNQVPGCKCEIPQLQTLTIKNGTVIKYYYACVKAKDSRIKEGDIYYNEYGLSDEQARQLIEAIETGSKAAINVNGVTYTLEKGENGTLTIKLASVNHVSVFRIPGEVVIGDHVYAITEIYKECFKDNKELTEVIIGSNITTIGDSAFEGCSSLRKMTFENGLINIGKAAFKNCNALISVKLPNTVQIIGNQAFMNCSSLNGLTLNDGLIKIGNSVFYNCKKLKKVKIPKTTLKIGAYTFEKCSKLTTLGFAEESDLLSIGTGTFSDCKSLSKVALPSKLNTIPTKAFYNCKALKSIKMGASVSKIGTKAFENCTKLQKITLEPKIQNIGERAFYNCKGLKLVTIKTQALTSVGDKAFLKCKKGIKFKIPANMKSLYIKLLKNKY